MENLTIATFFVAILSSILSGMSGGGGSLIMTPFYVFIGLSPQQIVGIGSVASLGLGGSSLIAMRRKQLINKNLAWPLGLLTAISTLAAMIFLPHIKSETFEVAIGFLLIVLAPTLFINKSSFHPGERGLKQIICGYILYTLLLFGNALGGSIAPLLFLPLMFLMGLTALEATALRRVMGIIQAITLFLVVLPQGFVVWSLAFASLTGCYLGGHIGTKIALKNGNQFVKGALAFTMVVSGLAILLFRR